MRSTSGNYYRGVLGDYAVRLRRKRRSAAAASSSTISDEPPRFDFAIESAYLFGAFNPPRNYEISADFLTARMRWGNYLDREGFFRGYNQVYFSFLAEPIIRGIENHYFGMNLGLRYNFVRHGSRFVPYFSGGSALGGSTASPSNSVGKGRISPSIFSAPRAFPINLVTVLAGRSVSSINTFLMPAKLIQTRV